VRRRATTQTVTSARNPAARTASERRETEPFESVTGELSAAMAQVTADAVDQEIEKWLGKICLVLNLDRGAIYERDAPGRPVRTSHSWTRPNFPPSPRKYDPEELFKKATDWVFAGNQLVFARPSEIPFEMRDARPAIERYGPKASAVIPMQVGGRVIGAASFGKFRSPREWSPKVLEHLALVVRIFGGAIERKQAEAAARLAREELALAQRRSMMGELVASLTHELNQPLGAVLSNLGGLARLLSQGNRDPALAAKAVDNAIEDTKRAGEIVRRVRAMFKGDGSRKASVEPAALVAEVVKLIGSEIALHKIRLRVEAAAVPPVFGDRILLQQCILNLLMNAFDAVANVETEKREVTITIAPEKQGWITTSVRDTGNGIHPSVAGRLFEPFVTSKTHGMGLGLLVTRSIVEDHGGKIIVKPNSDGGTTFTFTLPVAERRRSSASRRPSGKDPAKGL
jgi:signal transduction histidine kinase